jgi:hypothetical protein
MPSQKNTKVNKPTAILSIMALLALWLVGLLVLAGWYQSNYIHTFTQTSPEFLTSEYSEDWFRQLTVLLPQKKSKTRVVQLWKPDCVCNRFAQRHSLNTIKTSKHLKIDHITLIPDATAQQVKRLQDLNPDTEVMTLPSSSMKDWPASPSLFVESGLGKVQYFGPLGFGAFCGESSSNIIDQQLLNAQSASKPSPPFFNVIGKGCFCQWADNKG